MGEATRPTGDWAAQMVKKFAQSRAQSRGNFDLAPSTGPCAGCATTGPVWASLLGSLSAHDKARLPTYDANPEYRALVRSFCDELEIQNEILRPLGVERRVLCFLDTRHSHAFPSARAYNSAAPARRDALDELRIAAPIRCLRASSSDSPPSAASGTEAEQEQREMLAQLKLLSVPARKLAGVLAMYRHRRDFKMRCEPLRAKLPEPSREALAAQECPRLEAARLLHALRISEGPGVDVHRLHACLPAEAQLAPKQLRRLVRAADAVSSTRGGAAAGRLRTPSSASLASTASSRSTSSSFSSVASLLGAVAAWPAALGGRGAGEADVQQPALHRLSWRRVQAQAAGARAQGGPRAWGAKDKEGNRWRRNPGSGAWEKITLRMSMHRRPNGEPDFVTRIQKVEPASGPDFEPDF